MDQVISLRPFVPARDFAQSQAFYAALGFRITRAEADVAFIKTGSFSFILQNFYQPDLAGNFMMQLMVRDLTAWWADADPAAVAARFAAPAPKPPAPQPWGLTVGYITDPSGVLWHIAEALF